MEINIDDFSKPEQEQLQKALDAIEQSSILQKQIFAMTDLCFTQCVQKPTSELSRNDKSCLVNCTERFIDATAFIVKSFDLEKSTIQK